MGETMRISRLAVLALTLPASAPPHPAELAYRVRVDANALSRIDVTLRIPDAPGTVRLAMAAHPEYDDRFWRQVVDLGAERGGRPVPVVREDSALWRIAGGAGALTVHYAIALPPAESPRGAWHAFLTPTGGLIGGPHTFMYLVGGESRPSRVVLDLPAGWRAATGLRNGAVPSEFTAADAGTLIDSPILVGQLSLWPFDAAGIPHRIAYWRLPDAAPFDTVAFAGNLRRLATTAIGFFGSAPYPDYAFLLQDGAWGGLEHATSVTLGAPSEELAKDPAAPLPEIAHEYIHAWNLVYLHPAGYGALTWRRAPPSSGLWWSEGLTIYYSDVLLRRAGLPAEDSTRTTHVAGLIRRYLNLPGNVELPAELVSRAEYSGDPLMLGDYVASPHTQGELIGTLLDLAIRSSTQDRRSIDDVMRGLVRRYGGATGFTTADVEREASATCGCDLRPFFDAHVRRGGLIDFNRYLAMAGLRARVTWSPATDQAGAPAPDLWIRTAANTGPNASMLRLYFPGGVWGRAGLHTGDQLVAINGAPVSDWPGFRASLGRAHIGDTLVVDVRRKGAPVRATVIMAGYQRPEVVLDTIPSVSPEVRARRARWLAAAP
jgi:predicted metalloprotease with PDZ domain